MIKIKQSNWIGFRSTALKLELFKLLKIKQKINPDLSFSDLVRELVWQAIRNNKDK